MLLDDVKFAAYLDEAGDDLASASSILRSSNINYAILRDTWISDINGFNDNKCKTARTILDDNDISVISIACNKISDINRVSDIANYFKSYYIRIIKPNNITNIDKWLHELDIVGKERDLQLLLEPNITFGSKLDDLLLCSKYSNVRVLFDPVELLLKHNHNFIDGLFDPLINYISAVDIRDYKHGFGFKNIGFGSAQIKSIVSKLGRDFNGWYFMEPNLGRRYGSIIGRSEIFKSAVESFKSVLQEIK